MSLYRFPDFFGTFRRSFWDCEMTPLSLRLPDLDLIGESRMPRRALGQQRLFAKKLFYGDNLRILRMQEHFPPETVDLVYLDPPFKPNEQYNVLFREMGDVEVPSASQVRAFEDTWQWGPAARAAFNDVKENAPHDVRTTLEGLQSILGYSNMFAYVAMMAPRLVELRTVMKPTGSLYLHCDPAASHYLKVLLDAVFGPENFRSESSGSGTALTMTPRAMELFMM